MYSNREFKRIKEIFCKKALSKKNNMFICLIPNNITASLRVPLLAMLRRSNLVALSFIQLRITQLRNYNIGFIPEQKALTCSTAGGRAVDAVVVDAKTPLAF